MRNIRRFITPALLFSGVFFLYVHNLSRSVFGGDVGDLITASFVGGVAHAPGYPLFTFLGFLLTRIHFFPSPAFAVGLISAFSGALGILFFFLTIRLLTKSTWISILSSLILAFSYFYWFYSEIAEVFALNNLLLIILLYLSVKIMFQKSLKLLPLLCFVLGLSITNHQTIILTFPTVLIIVLPVIWGKLKKKKLQKKTVLLSLGAILAGFSVYSYVFIASSFHPILNWDNVKDISSFLHLFLRKDYGTFSAGVFALPSFLQRFILIKIYLTQVLLQLTIPVIAASFVGFVYSFRKQKNFAISLFIGFIISGPLFIAYAGFPLTGNFYVGVNERFFILSTIFIFYFFAFGLKLLSNIFKKFTRMNPVILQLVFFIIPFMLFMYNFPKTNLSQVYIGDAYAKDLLTPLPQNAILFVSGDTIIFNAWYEHYVLGVRSDVRLLNVNGNIGSPYYSVLKQQYLSQHPRATEGELQKGVVANLPLNGSVFSVESLTPETENNFLWIPYGLSLQLINKNFVPSEEEFTQRIDKVWESLHIPLAQNKTIAEKTATISDIPNSYANAMLITGNFYFSQYKDLQKSKEWFDKAILVAPEYDKSYSSLGVWYLANKNCNIAAQQFQNAIFYNPTEELNYLLLYTTYKSCLNDSSKTQQIEKKFQQVFKAPISASLDKVKKSQ